MYQINIANKENVSIIKTIVFMRLQSKPYMILIQ